MKFRPNGFAPIAIALTIGLLFAVGGTWYYTQQGGSLPWQSIIPSKQCGGSQDGSCQAGYRCIQRCGPPVVRDGDPPPPYYCERSDIANKPRQCPICLASNTTIATPGGKVNVRDIHIGTQVWSVDARGQKVASTVVQISRTAVTLTHQVVHLVLTDGRQVWLSPGHPTTSGTPVGQLQAGDVYDDAHVQSAELVLYWDDATYDLLPDTSTGDYWANGIRMGSTLLKGGGSR